MDASPTPVVVDTNTQEAVNPAPAGAVNPFINLPFGETDDDVDNVEPEAFTSSEDLFQTRSSSTSSKDNDIHSYLVALEDPDPNDHHGVDVIGHIGP